MFKRIENIYKKKNWADLHLSLEIWSCQRWQRRWYAMLAARGHWKQTCS